MYVASGDKSYALAAMMESTFPLVLEFEPERFNLLGPSDINLSDKAGHTYLKHLPVNRKMRRRLPGSRWIVHLYDGKNEQAAESLRKMESDTVTVLEIDIQRSKMYNMKGWCNVMKTLLWAACRGQLEGILGGPPREDSEDLRRRMMFLWMIAEMGAEKGGLRKPFFFMEQPGSMEWWKGDEWQRFRDEYQMSQVCVGANENKIFHGATNMNFLNYICEPLDGVRYPSTWTARLIEAVFEGIQDWMKWPDQVRQAQLLCKMEGRLQDMSEKDLKRWARHVRDGHVPFDKRCRTCVTNAASGRPHRRVLNPSAYVLSVDVAGPFRTKGCDADGKYRYVLVGSYCMPKLEGYKDVQIPDELPEEDDDGGGVGR